MNDVKMRRLAGSFSLAALLLSLGQFPLYMAGDSSVSVYDGAAQAQDLFRIRNAVFTRILLNMALYVVMMVFAAAFRELIRRSDPEFEWVGTLAFGAMVVWVGVTLVANGLEGGAVLDTLGGNADPSAVRAMFEGTLLIYNGPIAFVITGMFMATAAYATFATGILPRWTGWLAWAAVVSCAVSVPAIYGGPVDFNGWYNAGGWLPVLMANFPPALWFLVVGVVLVHSKQTPMPVQGKSARTKNSPDMP
ncbi:hypothetical protein FBY31_0362 [Arthrobacter sp. SLBN-100]|uniref:hypothetical protein n=1 Tax=Arthrobacter sp. SLBN-100 TaxID=2768450 RepID=UPI0011513E61|nr:hypothetical protein [Arthrobacter sp. SLBN-100]TQJ66354.1 hypothetical protein FBY31_0362 [Arthrobacter sp. SLBN-100]